MKKQNKLGKIRRAMSTGALYTLVTLAGMKLGGEIGNDVYEGVLKDKQAPQELLSEDYPLSKSQIDMINVNIAVDNMAGYIDNQNKQRKASLTGILIGGLVAGIGVRHFRKNYSRRPSK